MALQPSIRVNTPPVYGQGLLSHQTDAICSSLARYHLDQLSPAGWDAAGYDIVAGITSNDFHTLCHYDPDVWDLSASDVYHVRAALAYYQKRVDIDIGVDREAAALSKFRESERRCALINSRFRAHFEGRYNFPRRVNQVLHLAARKISKLLGDCPSVGEIPVRFGPGATTQVKKKNACLVSKLKSAPACSANLAHRAEELLASLYPFGAVGSELVIEIHDGVLAFVPKNAKTDRAICTEPSLNGLFQLGLGDLMAERLRLARIDIRDQTRNQRLAMYGSISGEIATLDLSSASDSVSIGLVMYLLPMDWAELILDLRTDAVVYNGERIVLEKVSSMGNGFTFPLETLIFWALAQSCVDLCKNPRQMEASVYGDDIIVPTDAVPLLREVLTETGFVLNDAKSFWDGPFRESCGHDYLRGISVRPAYVKGETFDNGACGLTTADLFRLHNAYYARGEFLACAMLRSWIHPSIRRSGPAGYGDGHLHGPWIPTLHRPKYKGECKQYSGYTFYTWSFSVNSLKGKLRERLLEDAKAKGSRIKYTARAYHHVMRIATYTSMISGRSGEPHQAIVYREDPVAHKQRRETSLHKWALDWQPSTPSDREVPWVTPGRGTVELTKIYIFEPATA